MDVTLPSQVKVTGCKEELAPIVKSSIILRCHDRYRLNDSSLRRRGFSSRELIASIEVSGHRERLEKKIILMKRLAIKRERLVVDASRFR